MKRALSLLCLLLIVTLALACRSSHQTPAGTQENFGVSMARMNLWREALFRFKRAVQITPDNAMAHNNLAVAYEANGDFENAAKEYREAMRLDKTNQYIQKNYSRFVEFTSRNKKRAPAKTAAGSTSAQPMGPTGVAMPAMTNPPPGSMGPTDVTLRPEGTQPATPPAPPSSQPSDQPPPPKPVPPGGV